MKEQNNPIKILLVDDHQIMINGMRSLLENEKELMIVGEMLNGHDALAFIKNNSVDIVITDISMPGMSGIELTKIIRKEYPAIKVIVLTMHNENKSINDIVEADASGYILKNITEKELIEAIHKVISGKKHYSDEVFQTMMSNMGSKKNEDVALSLTTREMEVLRLIAKEYSNEQIAKNLFISEHTVESHRKNIFRKTNTKSIVGLINYAHKHKLIS